MNQSKSAWNKRVLALKKAVSKGDLAAKAELGLLLQHGIQSVQGKALVRRSPKKGFQLLYAAALARQKEAFISLGYAYDCGLGTKKNEAEALRWYRRAVRNGDSCAATNIATIFRDRGNHKMAFKWWKHACLLGDGDATVDIGYCYQLGIGVKPNIGQAVEAYKKAMQSNYITECSREEAMYNYAVILIQKGTHQAKRRAKDLLVLANKDNDYPQADHLLRNVERAKDHEICLCRHTLVGHLSRMWCKMHSRSYA